MGEISERKEGHLALSTSAYCHQPSTPIILSSQPSPHYHYIHPSPLVLYNEIQGSPQAETCSKEKRCQFKPFWRQWKRTCQRLSNHKPTSLSNLKVVGMFFFIDVKTVWTANASLLQTAMGKNTCSVGKNVSPVANTRIPGIDKNPPVPISLVYMKERVRMREKSTGIRGGRKR